MYPTIDDFAAEWERECRLTSQVLDAVTDEALGQVIADGRRTLGQLGWHLVISIQFMTHLGLSFEGPPGGEEVPRSAAVIAQQYRTIAQAIQNAVKTQWTVEDLRQSLIIMGEEWENGDSLRYAIMHQAHHRGQMTVLMRQAGLRIPEIYGPTYESWVEKGLAPLA